jgi:hypothetical protein
MPNDASCNLQGGGTISVLLQFDTAAGTLKVGGAKPVADASQGYSFVQEDVSGVSVSPASLQASVDGSGKFSASAGVDVVLPAYLDQSDSNVMLLPMKALTVSGTLSSDGNCIGSYNASGLNPADSCLPTGDIPAFLDGGTLEAHITLEDADQVMLSVTQQSLCVLLSGNASQYADGARCKRDGDGTIVYQGDWCDLTNNAASGDCADSVRFQADIAASGVLINP